MYTISNTASFLADIREEKFSSSVVFASFDVVSLFTNIPIKETIQIATDKLCSSNNPPVLCKNTFTKLLDIACSDLIFLFDSKLYKQIDGCSMGRSLSPTLANIFMCNFEDQCLVTCPGDLKPIYYRRYVDDCFLVFKDKEHVELFATYINSKHPNIKFTYEIEENNCLPFLDCLLSKSDTCLSTSVYRKPTFTGLGLNFFSFIPKMYKINIIRTLLQRAYNVTSSFKNFHQEIEYLRINIYMYININIYIYIYLNYRYINKYIYISDLQMSSKSKK